MKLKNTQSLLFATITIAALLRFFEYFTIKNTQILPLNALFFEVIGFITDISIYVMFTILIIIIIYKVFSHINNRLAVGVVFMITSLILLIQIPLIKYYAVQNQLLGQVLLSYSVDELLFIMKVYSDSLVYTTLPLIIIPALLLFFFNIFNKILFTVSSKQAFKSIIVALLLFVTSIYFQNKFLSTQQYNLSVNKLYFLVKELILSSFNNINTTKNIKKHTSIYREAVPDKEFTDSNFPFLHKANYKNVLNDYFNKSKQAPNIVFIIVESLGRQISGSNALIGSFTPFLDSLAVNGLYWENFVSHAQRTFGVLPTSLGSLPWGNRGFSALCGDMPEHYSIVKLLNNNDYHSSFYYGGDLLFDDMLSFLGEQQFAHISSGSFNHEGGVNYWGTEDEELFKNSFLSMDSINEKTRFEVFLTLSTHGPFNYPNQKKYIEKLKTKIDFDTFTDKQIEYYKKYNDYCNAFFYFDEQLRTFFENYKKREEYERTIFFIFGDHSTSFNLNNSPLTFHHTPLIIYSPLLKKTNSFKGISSQFDLMPTIIGFLKDHYKFNFPEELACIGNSLDTSVNFEGNKLIPLMNIDRKFDKLIYKNKLFHKNKIYDIHDGMVVSESADNNINDTIYRNYESLTLLNRFVCKNNKWQTANNDKIFLELINVNEPANEDSTILYLNFFKGLAPPEYKDFALSASFEFYPYTNHRDSMPIYVIEIKTPDEKETILYHKTKLKREDWKPIELKKWQKVSLTLSTNIPDIQKGKYFIKAYLWNPQKIAIRYRNLKFKIFGIER